MVKSLTSSHQRLLARSRALGDGRMPLFQGAVRAWRFTALGGFSVLKLPHISDNNGLPLQLLICEDHMRDVP